MVSSALSQTRPCWAGGACSADPLSLTENAIFLFASGYSTGSSLFEKNVNKPDCLLEKNVQKLDCLLEKNIQKSDIMIAS